MKLPAAFTAGEIENYRLGELQIELDPVCADEAAAPPDIPESTTPFVYFLHDIVAELGKIARPDGHNAGVIQFRASAAAAGTWGRNFLPCGQIPSFELPAATVVRGRFGLEAPRPTPTATHHPCLNLTLPRIRTIRRTAICRQRRPRLRPPTPLRDPCTHLRRRRPG